MKQGKASRDVAESQKREPISRSVSVGAVSRLGALVAEGTPYKTLYNEEGALRAPKMSVKTSNSGSQGKY
jgi:hypothetical protein